MKKLIYTLIMILFATCLFASWNVGDIVDDFDDPTGERFVYSTFDGNFSNTATSSSKCNIRLSVTFTSGSSYPSPRFEFEIHEYGWDNPINDFYSDSKATIKVKEDDGTVTSFTKSNSKYSTVWNCLFNDDARTLAKMMMKNSTLKFAITIEKTKYSFTVDCTGFSEAFHEVFDNLTPSFGVWEKSYTDQDLYKVLIDSYASLGIIKHYAEFSYYKLEESEYNGQKYYISISLKNDDYEKDGYCGITIYLYKLVDDGLFTVSESFSNDELKAFAFIIDDKTYDMKVPSSDLTTYYYWSLEENPDKVLSAMKKGKKCEIKFTFKSAGSFTMQFDGADFLSQYEKAKTIPLF